MRAYVNAGSACSGSARYRNGRPRRRPRSPARPRTRWRPQSWGTPWCRRSTPCRAICTGPPSTGSRWVRPWSRAPGSERCRRQMVTDTDIEIRVNGTVHHGTVQARLTLADFLRVRCGLTGTHLGCEHGVCGACTVLVDGDAVRACLVFAVQADGCEVTTIEGIAAPDGELSVVQQAFREHHGLQCGFCTPGFVVSVTAFLRDNPDPSEKQIRE